MPHAPAHTDESVRVWLTTGDKSRLLSREADVRLQTDSVTTLPVITVTASTTYQHMIGLGAAFSDASVYLIQHTLTPEQRTSLLENLFGRTTGIGLSFMRVTMGSSDFSLHHYSYDDVASGQRDSGLTHFSIDADRADKLPVITRALAINPQITIVASPWSPPAWMKTSRSLITGTLEPSAYDAFANYFVRFVQAYRAEGVPITAVTLQNEPAFEPADYPGMRLDPLARASVIGTHLGPALEKAGLHTQIWDWDHNWDAPQQPLGTLHDSAARHYIQGVAWHCYGGDVSAQTKVHDAYPEKDVYFTECSGGEWAPVFADNLKWNVAQLIIGTTRNWARAVAVWNLALDEHGGPHAGGCGNCRGVVTIDASTGAVTRNVEYYALAHASKFVRPGAVRIASTTDVDGLQSVAFRNEDDASRVLIVLNSGTASRAFIVRTDKRSFTYALPAGAVATFVWNQGPSL
ncbi:MAG: glycoside hydrolase family 30 beta sandwich domain-containing protein [bacterium]